MSLLEWKALASAAYNVGSTVGWDGPSDNERERCRIAFAKLDAAICIADPSRERVG